jgi:hypothetical protein
MKSYKKRKKYSHNNINTFAKEKEKAKQKLPENSAKVSQIASKHAPKKQKNEL